MLCLHLCCNCSLQIHDLEELSSGDRLKDEHWEVMAVLRDWRGDIKVLHYYQEVQLLAGGRVQRKLLVGPRLYR